ncbi:MAG TPA: Ku protein [Chitinispirillaceae bacterium]|nr:Ku protein [Chitinispirillaceae bacterium]
MRSIWSGALSFGLIYIPVKLYDATRSHTIDFDLLRRSDHCRIHYAKVCRETGEEIPKEQIVRGYQYTNGKYVTIEDDDFLKANVKKSQTIEIAAFIDESEIESSYLEKPYFLEPAREASKAYALLREALLRSGKAGIARYVMRRREHMALIKATESVILLNNMRFADELRSHEELNLPAKGLAQLNEKELDLAIKLIGQLTETWKPQQYNDTYYEELKALLKRKIEGKAEEKGIEISAPETAITDLFSRLNQSLELARSKNKKAA